MLTDTPAAFVPVLRQLEQDGLRYFGNPHPRVEPMEHTRREFSELLRIRVALEGRSIGAYVKIAKPKGGLPADHEAMARRVASGFDATLALHRSLSASSGVTTVRPIACFPEHLALVTEQAIGTTLLDTLSAGVRRGTPGSGTACLEDSLERVGGWLRAFQQTAAAGAMMTQADVREYLDVRLRRLVARGERGLAPREREALLDGVEALWPQLAPGDLVSVPIHADFALGNLLVHANRVTILDFDMASRGSRYHDLAHPYMQIDLLKAKPWLRRGSLTRVQRALLRGFDPAASEADPLFRLMLLQHVVCHLERLVDLTEGPIARLYTARQQQRHRRWLKAFIERPEGRD